MIIIIQRRKCRRQGEKYTFLINYVPTKPKTILLENKNGKRGYGLSECCYLTTPVAEGHLNLKPARDSPRTRYNDRCTCNVYTLRWARGYYILPRFSSGPIVPGARENRHSDEFRRLLYVTIRIQIFIWKRVKVFHNRFRLLRVQFYRHIE